MHATFRSFSYVAHKGTSLATQTCYEGILILKSYVLARLTVGFAVFLYE